MTDSVTMNLLSDATRSITEGRIMAIRSKTKAASGRKAAKAVKAVKAVKAAKAGRQRILGSRPRRLLGSRTSTRWHARLWTTQGEITADQGASAPPI
jgi:hypothetical protein